MHTNAIGPLLTAQHILSLSTPSPNTSPPALPIYTRTLVFTSSDSGSTANFRSFEDGFGAYAASKAALNQGLRHLAAEIHRKSNAKSHGRGERTVVLAIHPGEVSTDMASNVTLDWEVEGVISSEESIRCMLRTIAEKGWGGLDEGGTISAQKEGRKVEDAEASFWTWEGIRYPW
jgi:NAD(P)-dependent dehydrogenase (short-subunit alcohol dehydrogenase family)